MRNRHSLCVAFVALTMALGSSSARCADTGNLTASATEVEKYEKRLLSYETDLNAIAKGLTGLDQEVAIALTDQADKMLSQAIHVQDLLLIESLIPDAGDKRRVRPVVAARLRFVTENIDLSIKSINNSLIYLKNPGVVAIANDLKRDLRVLKELLLKL